MQVRRAAAVTGTVAALVLLGGPVWADDPVEGDPYCFSASPVPVEEPSEEATAAVTDEAAPEPTEEATPEPGVEASAEPTDATSEEPTQAPDPTLDPDPSADPDATEDPVSYIVCASGASAGGLGEGEPTLGSGATELPTTGAPVGRYAATGFALVLAGAGTVLLVGRRSA